MQVKDAYGQGLFLIYKAFFVRPKGRFFMQGDPIRENKKARTFGPDNIFNLALYGGNVNNFQQNGNKL